MNPFDFALGPDFVTYYCGGIVASAVLIAVCLVWQAFFLHRRLSDAQRRLKVLQGKEEFTGGFESYDTHIKTAIGQPWAEFVETLVLPEPDSGEPIRNTSEVSRYLNDATVIFPRISSGFYQSVPNLLTGTGILGTFIGLAGGVGAASTGLSSGNPGEITASLQRLLDGASLAFLTSIAGITCSMGFVVVERWASRWLHLSLDRWVGAIESRLKRVTPEGVALDQLDQARRATIQLERFNTDLIFAIEQALEDKIAGRLSPQLERLVSAVEGLRGDRATDAGRMIEQALGRFTDALQERAGSQFDEMASIVSDLNRALKEAADGMTRTQNDVRGALDAVLQTVETSMRSGAAAMTETLQQSLDSITKTLADASERHAAQVTASGTAAAAGLLTAAENLEQSSRSGAAAMTETLQQSLDSITKTLADASERHAAQVQGTVGSVTQALAKTGADVAEQISGSAAGLLAATDKLEQSSRQSQQVLAGMNQFVEQIGTLRGTIEAAHRQIADIAEPVGRAARDIRAASDKTADILTRTSEAVGRIDAAVNQLERHQQEIAGAWTRYQERFEGIDRSLEQVFRQITEGLSGYCEKVKDFANELDRTTAKTTEDLAGATAELADSIEDLISHLPEVSG